MGYRLYLGSIPKKGMRKYRKASEVELARMLTEEGQADNCVYGSNVCPSGFPFLTEILCLGKYCDYNPNGKYKNFFSFDYSDGEFTLVDKEFLGAIIEEYRKSVEERYIKMSNSFSLILPEFTRGRVNVDENGEFKVSIDVTMNREILEGLLSIREKLSSGSFTWAKRQDYCTAFDLEDKGTEDFITRSWSYEYAVFNLVHLYKTFNFEKNYLIYFGY